MDEKFSTTVKGVQDVAKGLETNSSDVTILMCERSIKSLLSLLDKQGSDKNNLAIRRGQFCRVCDELYTQWSEVNSAESNFMEMKDDLKCFEAVRLRTRFKGKGELLGVEEVVTSLDTVYTVLDVVCTLLEQNMEIEKIYPNGASVISSKNIEVDSSSSISDLVEPMGCSVDNNSLGVSVTDPITEDTVEEKQDTVIQDNESCTIEETVKDSIISVIASEEEDVSEHLVPVIEENGDLHESLDIEEGVVCRPVINLSESVPITKEDDANCIENYEEKFVSSIHSFSDNKQVGYSITPAEISE